MCQLKRVLNTKDNHLSQFYVHKLVKNITISKDTDCINYLVNREKSNSQHIHQVGHLQAKNNSQSHCKMNMKKLCHKFCHYFNQLIDFHAKFMAFLNVEKSEIRNSIKIFCEIVSKTFNNNFLGNFCFNLFVWISFMRFLVVV